MERLMKNYFRDDMRRAALNALTKETFGFDFTDWYGGGYFTGDYIPYSFETDGKIISNASANIMKFVLTDACGKGIERTYIQIGTVMTAPEYRRRGLAGRLIREIIKDYKDQCDGIYLFANLSALDFYKDLGFWESIQYRRSVKKDTLSMKREPDFVGIADKKEKRQQYLAMVQDGVCSSAFEQTNKFGLQMFYTGDFQNVYYSESLDCFAAYEHDDHTLYLNSIIADQYISAADILAKIPLRYDQTVVGFTPRKTDSQLFESEEFDGGNDYRLFCMGDTLKEIEEKRLYFPEYSHA